jgi:hypothetical protein
MRRVWTNVGAEHPTALIAVRAGNDHDSDSVGSRVQQARLHEFGNAGFDRGVRARGRQEGVRQQLLGFVK